MARPAADMKILKSNRSTYNLIAHDHHVPKSPLFGQFTPRPHAAHGRKYDTEKADDNDQKGYEDDVKPDVWKNTYNDDIQQKPHALVESQANEDILPTSRMIKHDHHIPASPLYRPGQGHTDPRYGSAHGARGHYHRGGPDCQVPRPKDPPTPDYNTTQLHIPDTSKEDEEPVTKLKLEGLRKSQEDLREHPTNNTGYQDKQVNWNLGYTDRQGNRGQQYTDRPSYGEDRPYRENPWTSRLKVQADVPDPRVGGQHDGIELVASRNGGALLFIRFPVGHGENIQVAAQAFLKSKTHDNGGQFLGLAKKVHDFGYEKGPTEAIGVFHFPSIDKAFLFFQMDPILRQPDFPPPYGHAEMWIVCNAYLPDNLRLFNTFLLSEVELHNGKDKREFFDTFQKPFESYLYKQGAMPFVVCSYGSFDRKSLRRHSYPPTSVVTCHLFQGLDHLNWITSDETYSKFRSLHNQMATEKCSIFTLSRDMFP